MDYTESPTMYHNVKLDVIGKANHMIKWQQQPAHEYLRDCIQKFRHSYTNYLFSKDE